jgi:hypothetical protein
MTTPRNEVFMSLGPEETAPLTTSSASTEVEVELAPPPPPAQGLAEFPEAKTPDSSDPDVSVVDMEMERRRYIEEGKRQTLKRYEIQESKRAPRIQIDQRVVLMGWISAVSIAFLSSAIVSFNGITSVAVFVGLSQAWMAPLFFFFIELMYLLFLVAYLVLASRTDDNGKRERTGGAITGMIFFAGVAVLANAFHTFDYWEWNFLEPRAWAGVVLSVSAPIAIISVSKMASRVVFSRAVYMT